MIPKRSVLMIVAVGGLAPDLLGPPFAGCVIGMLILALFAVTSARADRPPQWSHITLAGSMAR